MLYVVSLFSTFYVGINIHEVIKNILRNQRPLKQIWLYFCCINVLRSTLTLFKLAFELDICPICL